MFEQHPVPQQISSYQFRLVGDMTLKQFFQLAAGAVLGLIIYATPLPTIFKWPLIIFFVVMGAAFAFLPLQERPLSEWIAAFFRAVYGPTLFTWQRGSEKTQYFAQEGSVTTPPAPSVSHLNAKVQDASVAKLEASENKFLNNLGGLFGIGSKNETPQSPLPTPTPVATILQESPKPVVVTQQQVTPRVTSIPQIAPISVPKQTTPIQPAVPTVPTQAPSISTVQPVMRDVATAAASAAQFSPDAAPPTPATIPNIIVGQVTDLHGKIIEGAIMEIKDFQGRPVRALKTNKLGHFMIVTPLPSGGYNITVEKEGLTFDPVSIEVHGAIIPPILIKAKEESNPLGS